jgi:hypothetical protein
VKHWLLPFFLLLWLQSFSQDTLTIPKPQSAQNTSRKWLIGGLTAGGYGGSFLFLSTAWYKDYPRRTFHTFNDNGEWKQMDKVGHAWTTYHTSRLATELWRWAGLSKNQSLLLGTGSSLLYLSSIEYLDGHSVEWGWSWGDVGANLFGSALFSLQDLGWDDQKLSLKFSSHRYRYAERELEARADKLFGSSFQGRLLKDYNAQTYWLSANLKAFLTRSSLPTWLNLAVGYGADGMFGGRENIVVDRNGNLIFDRRDILRHRQLYLAPDVDFTKIRTKSKVLKSVFSALNVLKFPTPAIEFSKGRLQLKALAY